MRNTNTTAWHIQVWTSFVVASTAMIVGILYLPVDAWVKGFLGMGLLFTVGSCFSLAKTIRDEQEMKVRLPEPERVHPFRSAA